MSSITRKVLTALVASAATASIASAQLVGYSTTARFTGGCVTGGYAASATCMGGGFTLNFTGAPAVLVGTPTVASLGEFTLTGAGDITVPGGVVFLDILVTQTVPTGGTGNVIGTFSGRVTTNSSQLIFTPDDPTFSIGPVNYSVILEPGGVRSIAINRQTSLETSINVVPEPATVLLMGSGLAALGFFGARRKNA